MPAHYTRICRGVKLPKESPAGRREDSRRKLRRLRQTLPGWLSFASRVGLVGAPRGLWD